jgi:hypothetical protein
MSDYYTESQMQRIEQAAYDGAMLEAGKEWERQRYEFGATEAKLAERVTELEARIAEAKKLLEDDLGTQLPVTSNYHYLILRRVLRILDGGGK